MQTRTLVKQKRTQATRTFIARARGPYGECPGCPAGHSDPDKEPDSRTFANRTDSTSAGLSACESERVGGGQAALPLTPDTLPLRSGRPASGVGAEVVGGKARTAEHRAKLAHDPRFAGWLGLIAQDDPPPDPAAISRQAERDELMRRACIAHLELASRGLATGDPHHTQWCRDFVATTAPLGRPLGTGDPEQT